MTQTIKTIEPSSAEGKTRELYQAVEKKLGRVPNLMKTLGNSPAALEGYLSLAGALEKGTLSARVREQIALTVAEENGCQYCLSAHSAIGKMVGLDAGEIGKARRASANDAKTAAALQFAQKIVDKRGEVGAEDLQEVREAGWSEAGIVEIVVHVALNVLTNYINIVAATEIDFPRAAAIGESAA